MESEGSSKTKITTHNLKSTLSMTTDGHTNTNANKYGNVNIEKCQTCKHFLFVLIAAQSDIFWQFRIIYLTSQNNNKLGHICSVALH